MTNLGTVTIINLAGGIDLSNTAFLLDEIANLPYLTIPEMEAETIQVLIDKPSNMYVKDITNDVLVFWNGTEWREVTTIKSINY